MLIRSISVLVGLMLCLAASGELQQKQIKGMWLWLTRFGHRSPGAQSVTDTRPPQVAEFSRPTCLERVLTSGDFGRVAIARTESEGGSPNKS